MVTTLFFMWGFLTSLNDILIPHLKTVFDLNYAKAMLIQFAFFTSYFVFSLPVGKIDRRGRLQESHGRGIVHDGHWARCFFSRQRAYRRFLSFSPR